MRFVVTREGADGSAAPLPGAVLQTHAFGDPASEAWPAWTVEVADLPALLALVRTGAAELSLSAWWSGASMLDPGERLYAIDLKADTPARLSTDDRGALGEALNRVLAQARQAMQGQEPR